MTDKFTPGPWLYGADAKGETARDVLHGRVWDASGAMIADLRESPRSRKIRNGNGRLCAASPALLAACRKALPIVAAMCNALGETCDEEAADALGSLREVLALFPED